ncbi:MAG TPA: biotin synthase [Rubrivivax sp.]|nr:biotin synthase [Rubrivivax sp.]
MAPTEPSAAVPSRPLDAVALARHRARLLRAAEPPWLHGEVARRMAERLPVIRLQPQQVVDWDAPLGASGDLLAKAYPHARVLSVQDHVQRPAPAAWWSPSRWFQSAGRHPVEPAELEPGQAQLVWANMALHWSADPQTLLRQWHGALAVDGFLMFSTLGPGSLTGLRELYATQAWPDPFTPFVDMHDFGDMLVEAGFADPVMDQEQVTLTFGSPKMLLDELRSLGGNTHSQRNGGLRTPRWLVQLVDALQAGADTQGRTRLVFELVYGHAFKAAPRARVAPETTLPLDDMRALIRAGRQRG